MLLAARLCPDPLRQLNHSSRLLAAAKGEGTRKGRGEGGVKKERGRESMKEDCLCQLRGWVTLQLLCCISCVNFELCDNVQLSELFEFHCIIITRRSFGSFSSSGSYAVIAKKLTFVLGDVTCA